MAILSACASGTRYFVGFFIKGALLFHLTLLPMSIFFLDQPSGLSIGETIFRIYAEASAFVFIFCLMGFAIIAMPHEGYGDSGNVDEVIGSWAIYGILHFAALYYFSQ